MNLFQLGRRDFVGCAFVGADFVGDVEFFEEKEDALGAGFVEPVEDDFGAFRRASKGCHAGMVVAGTGGEIM